MRATAAVALVVLLLGHAVASAAPGQDEASLVAALKTGARVRVRTTSQSVASRGLVERSPNSVLTVTGVVETVDPTELTIARRDQVKLPLSAIRSVDVSVGKKRMWWQGLGFGVLVGLIAGATAPVGDCSPNNADYFCTRGEAIGVNTLVLGGTFTVVGALFKTDRWERRFSR